MSPRAGRPPGSACRRASGEPRVASRSAGSGHDGHRLATTQRSKSVRSASTRRSPRGVPAVVLEGDRRLMQQFGHHRPGHRIDLFPLGLGEFGPLRPLPVQLRTTGLLGPGPEGGHHGGGVAGPGGYPVPLDLVGDDAVGLGHLLLAAGQGVGHRRPQHLHVEQDEPFEIGRRRFDVPGYTEVDHQQGLVGPTPVEGRLDHGAVDDGMGGTDGREHHVGRRPTALPGRPGSPRSPGRRRRREAGDHGLGPVGGAVGHDHAGRARPVSRAWATPSPISPAPTTSTRAPPGP